MTLGIERVDEKNRALFAVFLSIFLISLACLMFNYISEGISKFSLIVKVYFNLIKLLDLVRFFFKGLA